MTFRLILASSSPYRRELLERLRLPFECVSPEVNETPLQHEDPEALSTRLALEKCLRVARHYPDAWVIGSDQVASASGEIFGKPGTHERALEQLKKLQGKTLDLFTAMCVWNPIKHKTEQMVDHTCLTYAVLDEKTLNAYIQAEQPFQCAASSKIETLGIGLLESLKTNDPTAIIGLPLIALTTLFRENGLNIFLRA